MTDEIRSPKEAAVSQWESALEDLSDEKEYKETLQDADIHDKQDRMEVQDILQYEVTNEDFVPLVDAWTSLTQEFGDLWE